MGKQKPELPQGTFDMLALKALSLGPMHGYGIGRRIQQLAENMLNLGAVYREAAGDRTVRARLRHPAPPADADRSSWLFRTADLDIATLETIRSLPEAYRETLVLRLVEGMTGPEIATRTGLTPASVRVNLHRGMRMLRERLDGRVNG